MAHKNDGQYNPLVDPITPFHSRAVPRISIDAYLTRILQFIPFTNEVLLNVLVFLDRIGGLGGMENEIVGLMEATSPRPAATHQHPPPPSVHNGDSNRNAEHLAKRARFQDPVATERAIASSTTVDAHITPGGATPAPTPKMTAAPNGFRVNSFNIHRLLITCLMVAAKFTSDLFYSNARYAKVGGLSLPELNQLELVFLFTTQFDLNVKEEELQRVGDALLKFKNRETTTSDSQVSLPAPPAAIAAQVARTVVVVSNNANHPNTINTVANTNAVNGDGHPVLQTNVTAITKSSSEMIVDPRQQPPRAGRFSIPSPTSPNSGPMSDRGLPQKPIPSLPSSSTSSSSSSSSTSTASSTTTATLHSVSSSAGHSTTVVASGSRSQPPQLLSPPEEKCGRWAERGTGGDSRDVYMATPAPTPSALSSSMPTEFN
ncbi:hypothetical protein EC957_012119 [Mortierella hygrophila]|uniref:Cyclin-domain-containing protein n=1 Tax=Mortierella hygrophila TaxID=979708 RepID=A0A9P6F7W1_9FUNG|nr:hypothetical protein EC957_012119 [Mortierella hygrophila]